MIKAVIERPSECAERRDFQGELDFYRKGGGGGKGVKNGKKPEKTQFFMAKSGRYGPLSCSNATDSSASRTDSSEFKRDGDQKRPHPSTKRCIEASQADYLPLDPRVRINM